MEASIRDHDSCKRRGFFVESWDNGWNTSQGFYDKSYVQPSSVLNHNILKTVQKCRIKALSVDKTTGSVNLRVHRLGAQAVRQVQIFSFKAMSSQVDLVSYGGLIIRSSQTTSFRCKTSKGCQKILQRSWTPELSTISFFTL